MGWLVNFIPGAIQQGIPLLYGCTGEILTEKPFFAPSSR